MFFPYKGQDNNEWNIEILNVLINALTMFNKNKFYIIVPIFLILNEKIEVTLL